uniref:Uncharacterized protein n=2 Tax=Physcomitrium patens TaxID=3218 RepID=A0A7I4C282_PHYPA
MSKNHLEIDYPTKQTVHAYREHLKNYIPYYLYFDESIHPKLVVVQLDLPCFMCGEKKEATTMLLCNQWEYRWHMVCLTSLLLTLLFEDWICPCCKSLLAMPHLLIMIEDFFYCVSYILTI